MNTRYHGSADPLDPDNRPHIIDDDCLVAGRLLAYAAGWPGSHIARYATRLAQEIAAHGIEHGRGWLTGIWYVRGVNRVSDDSPLTYHSIVLALQPLVGLELVTAGRQSDAESGS